MPFGNGASPLSRQHSLSGFPPSAARQLSAPFGAGGGAPRNATLQRAASVGPSVGLKTFGGFGGFGSGLSLGKLQEAERSGRLGGGGMSTSCTKSYVFSRDGDSRSRLAGASDASREAFPGAQAMGKPPPVAKRSAPDAPSFLDKVLAGAARQSQ
mmetsp:Transcript_34581/g.86282  ORF Transcript_34581/g.86282 Transcript_34581/m.86282 type:complete len:155 (+) Transcript_34581:1450-1914(+)